MATCPRKDTRLFTNVFNERVVIRLIQSENYRDLKQIHRLRVAAYKIVKYNKDYDEEMQSAILDIINKDYPNGNITVCSIKQIKSRINTLIKLLGGEIPSKKRKIEEDIAYLESTYESKTADVADVADSVDVADNVDLNITKQPFVSLDLYSDSESELEINKVAEVAEVDETDETDKVDETKKPKLQIIDLDLDLDSEFSSVSKESHLSMFDWFVSQNKKHKVYRELPLYDVQSLQPLFPDIEK